ncbi:hypothetical protein EGM51_00190 [Verrucomicrobia bacterium S94]|nr:hypothetical protein EGM51_00190 [Verrucomicrobia bacterium S94]
MLKIKHIMTGVPCCAIAALQTLAAEPVITYDFENQDGWLSAPSQTVATNGVDYQVVTSDRIFGIHRNGDDTEGLAWQKGFIFLFGTVDGEEQGFINFNTNGVAAAVRIHSIEIGSSAASNTVVEGLFDGDVVWSIVPTEPGDAINGFPVYTSATSGDMSGAIDQIRWTCSGNNWTERINDIQAQVVPAIKLKERIYQWSLDSYWTPHSVWKWAAGATEFSYLGFEQYWWSGNQSTNDAKVIRHRPGMADLPEGGGYDTVTGDINVGGLPSRGLWVTNAVRTLITNETLEVTFDYKLYVNGSEDARFMDMFFSTTGDDTAKALGINGNELGFALHQTSVSNDIAVTFDPSDPYMSTTAPVLRVPLTDLGINVASDLEGDDLSVTYTARKIPVADTWLCSLVISNKMTAASFSASEVPVVNAAVYNAPSYFGVYTVEDLSNGDLSSGTNTAGYDIDQLNITILMNQPPEPAGFEAFLIEYGIAGEPNSGAYEDFDADGVLNLYEYGWAGNPTNPADVGVLPEMTVSNGVVYFTVLEVTDPLSGIDYNLLSTTDLIHVPFSAVDWDSTNSTPYDAIYDYVTRGKATESRMFFKATISTNTP